MQEELESDYPTAEQIKEMFEAWKRNRESGIREVLQKRREELRTLQAAPREK
jgi:hypothetical protein